MNDLFTPIADKISCVGKWSVTHGLGITNQQLTAARVKAELFVAKYKWGQAKTEALLDIVITPYLSDPVATANFLCDRIGETHGLQRLIQLNGNSLRLRKGVADHRSCLRVEVVNLGANWGMPDGYSAWNVRENMSAHAAVLTAVAQDHAYGARMDGLRIPQVRLAGYEFNGAKRAWERVPGLEGIRGGMILSTFPSAAQSPRWSIPLMLE